MKSLASQAYWDTAYQRAAFAPAGPENPLRTWLSRHVPRTTSGRCIEIGCFPGTYSAVLGELGYELNGMDLTPRSDDALPAWLASLGHRVGTFRREDFFEVAARPVYDVVCSFGFIEHFVNWGEVLRRHADFVRPGGLLVVTTPNFRGAVQHALHWLVDRQSLERHNLDSMAVRRWPPSLGPRFSSRVCGYFGRFDFWANRQQRNLAQKAALLGIRATLPCARRAVRFDSETLSPYCGLVAQRVS
jgi:L-malate glycosyltransferase